MFHRRKLLLALLNILGGKSAATDFQKILFLVTKQQDSPSYDFVPYRYGSFSFLCYSDKRWLMQNNFLENMNCWKLIGTNADYYINDIKTNDESIIKEIVRTYGKLKGKLLVKEVYRQFPFYASRSEIANQILTTEEQKKIDKEAKVLSPRNLFSLIQSKIR